MNGYRITYAFDGYRFVEIVSAETAEIAKDYLLWIVQDNNDHRIISIEETKEIASYYAPAAWTRPESIKAARARCLLAMLEHAGINCDRWSAELHAVMIGAGYQAAEYEDTDWNETTVYYTKANAAPLLVEK